MPTRIQKYARENRNNMTPQEKKIWYEVLARKQTGYKFLHQHPVGEYITDFYCRELKLVIEIDGDSHSNQQQYDKQRSHFLRSRGLNVIRFNNRDVLDNINGIKDVLYEYINKNPLSPPSPSSGTEVKKGEAEGA